MLFTVYPHFIFTLTSLVVAYFFRVEAFGYQLPGHNKFFYEIELTVHLESYSEM